VRHHLNRRALAAVLTLSAGLGWAAAATPDGAAPQKVVTHGTAVLTLRLPQPGPSSHWQEKDVREDTTYLFIPEDGNADSLLDSPAYWRKFPPDRVLHVTPTVHDVKVVIECDSAAHTISVSVAHGMRWTRAWTLTPKAGATRVVTHWDLRSPQGDRVLPGTYTVMASSYGRGGEGGLILIGR
jgi:hypothetical protein